MNQLVTFLTAAIIVFCVGCTTAPIVTSGELDYLKTKWQEPKVSIWYYVGSKDSYHYFTHKDLGGTKTYRISEAEQKMADPFFLTSDETSWRIMFWGARTYLKKPTEKEWEPNKPVGLEK